MVAQSNFDSKTFLPSLTRRPGVYRMLDSEGDVLYVGKARNLRNRVTSYFRASGLATKTIALMNKVDDIQVTVTASETEALLLEQSLIKADRPMYNVLFRDDKSYPYICLTEHTFPRLALHRGTKQQVGRYFGPYPSAGAVRESIQVLQKLFQLRSCEDGFYKNRSRPCLQHQIGRCSAPCVGRVESEDYAADVGLAQMFLEGRSRAVLQELKQRMESASKAREFEHAARYRDQIAQLRRIQENQYVHGESGEVDVFALAQDSSYTCVQGLFIRGGRVIGQRTWYPKNELDTPPGALLSSFVSQYYLASEGRVIPKLVLTSIPLDEEELVESVLAGRSGRKVSVTSKVRAQRARWLEMARDNAALSLTSYVAERRNVFSRFVDLQDLLELEDMPKRLECFDISHTSGEATVASCVVFDTNGPLKSDYRRFNIEGVTAGDDYAAMEQALRRRYRRLKEGEAVLPDLLVIDGGQGQLGKAAGVLSELQVDDIGLIGVAKGPARKAGLEKILLYGQGELSVPATSGSMHLLQHIRDEAHRFAITGHRGRRAKNRRRSALDGIVGIGPKRKRELMAYIGSLATIKGASSEEIAKVPGISQKLADDIYGALHAA
ncbi:MAG: excinuclease ABC subunit UvrC [Pseudomonadales bacterium]|nr:excinuclease ABC subunit UvrC [Pseudomonadales bacterium]